LIKPFGIALRLHPAMVLVMLCSVLTGYFVELLTLFGIVLVHEMGHVAAMRRFGWNIREVQLLPFGGVAVTDHAGQAPAREEIIVALAGPLQNGWMILAAQLLGKVGVAEAEWVHYFTVANLLIGAFNLLPVYPLDGGRIFHAVCTLWMSYHRSIVLVTWVSLVFSVLLVALSLGAAGRGIQVNLLVIGLFLLISNWHRLKQIPYLFLRFLMNREHASRELTDKGTLARPIVVNGRRSLSQIVRLFMLGQYHLVYIMNDAGELRTVVPEEQVIRVFFSTAKPGSAVSEFFM
jgi:stage IV sporulation protein FB